MTFREKMKKTFQNYNNPSEYRPAQNNHNFACFVRYLKIFITFFF